MQRVANYKYRTIKRIGSGGFGYVDKIELFNLTETYSSFYAMKVLAPQVELKKYKERFQREVLSQCKCQHSNVVHIYICDLYGESPFFIMELGECDLQSLINQGQLTEHEKIDIIRMVCLGVSHIHSLGYLHRDIKPYNILKFKNGVYKISDFGLVRKKVQSEDSEVLTSLNIRLGTDNYVAPELMYIGSDYTEKTDIFAMGKVFEQLNVKDQNVQKIIAKCTKMDPENRYSSVNELMSDLRSLSVVEV
ncbi:serine/threonine-protein kinase [Vibrio cholerae]|uniref:protein kinase domain-containing protein n=1 Tax=Vibrio cholerae TaxID=666 RepID=UPI001A9DF6A6|nr:serine/threonine protein kinase [Vibrio cholerae]EKO4195385.1 serine/threonine protein kinase [Vibrio cholerae]MBO1401644.1 serine/threonine protein kinase [Vibrio cholerae]